MITYEKTQPVNYNFDNFPIVYVKFNYVTCDKDYDFFENSWLELYKKSENFYFIFDTTNIHNVHLKYAYKLVTFINFLKREIKIQYLKHSIIIVGNNIIKNILNLVFKISTPVAPVYIVNKCNYYDNLCNDIINKKNISDKIIYVSN
tara:strand:+ start:682 stop:1122 length:441 start_codon:yes stop_codon:yes gene_type:complete